MGKKVKVFSLVVVIVMAFVLLTGCAQPAEPQQPSEAPQQPSEAAPATTTAPPETSPEESSSKVVIGCSIQGNQSTFMQYVVAGMYQYAEENPDIVEIKVVYANDDAVTQCTQVETMIQEGIDALVINPVDPDASSPAVDACKAANIPVITVNTTVNNDYVAAHVGSDDVESGRLQMERIISVCGENAKVGYINAVIGHSAQVGREKGYKEVLAKYPTVELVAYDCGNWSGDESMQIVENWLAAGKEFDAILCQADCQLVGVIQAVKNAGLLGKIKLAGMDCIDDIMEQIAAGNVDNSIWQDGVGQGYHSVRIAIDAAKGVAVQDYMIPYEVCSVDNYQEYLKKIDERNALAAKYF